MKKFLRLAILLLLIAALLPLNALAEDFSCEADPYLVGRRWEMKVGNWGNTSTMIFYEDGTGIRETIVANASSEGNYDTFHYNDFTWTTVDLDGICYMILCFRGTNFGGLEWGTYHHPYERHTYQLLWHPDFMYFMDTCHNEIDDRGFSTNRTIYLSNPVPTQYF